MKNIKKTEIILLEMKTTICEMKNTLNGVNGILDIAKEKIKELEGKAIKPIQNETYRKKMQKLNATLSCDSNFKLPNIWITGALNCSWAEDWKNI